MEVGEVTDNVENVSSKSHTCEECLKTFAQPGTLHIHKRIHSGERPFPCNVCSRKFTNAGNLKVHVRVHTGEKPYQCVFCQKCFSQQNTLKSHVRIHTGEKPFDCSICNRSFRVSANLRKHETTHIKLNASIGCPFCVYKFRTNKDFERHVGLFHPGQVNAAPIKSKARKVQQQQQQQQQQVRENYQTNVNTNNQPVQFHVDQRGQLITQLNPSPIQNQQNLSTNVNETLQMNSNNDAHKLNNHPNVQRMPNHNEALKLTSNINDTMFIGNNHNEARNLAISIASSIVNQSFHVQPSKTPFQPPSPKPHYDHHIAKTHFDCPKGQIDHERKFPYNAHTNSCSLNNSEYPFAINNLITRKESFDQNHLHAHSTSIKRNQYL